MTDKTNIKKVASVGILVADVMAPIGVTPKRSELARVDSITAHNGGNAMTAALNLGRMGVKAKMIGKVGDDLFGKFLIERLVSGGVGAEGVKVDPVVQTSVSVVLLDGGERSFLHCVGANATFSIEDIDFSVIEGVDLVFVTGSFLMDRFDGEETREFLKRCKEMGKTTFLDVCFDAKGRWGELIDPALPYVDFFRDVGIDTIVSPKSSTVDYIVRFVRGMANAQDSEIESLHRMMDGGIEAVEFIIKENIEGVTDVPLSSIKRIKNSLIACIVRDGNVIIPSGSDVISKGDRVIVLVTGSIKNIKDILD
jgi:hypothetical protein